MPEPYNILKDVAPHLDAQLTERLHRFLPDLPLVVNAIEQYARYGRMPGGFMTAVLEGKLFIAAMCADTPNLAHLGQIAMAIVYFLPAIAYGSEARVKAYCNLRKGSR